ncbi:MAG: AI-2E family transporter [Sphingopyxis sp.]|uniref:AI-2E family transporter n=1 Tax=Sphingopyxis sp. TaxID=1908224 RepID=UPI002AB8B516|nr:AI-2E family transporter [Sphingopyxis sp.]MDZ3831706.1 AI-2E family transporter [Sphingopyxis sp.]
MPDGKRDEDQGGRWPFLAILMVVSAAFLVILWPFLAAILWAVIVAILFEPIHRRLLAKMPGRKNSSAMLTLLLIIAVVILPATVLMLALVGEATAIYSRIQTGDINLARSFAAFRDGLPEWASDGLERLGLTNLAAARDLLGDGAADGLRAVLVQALQIGQGLFSLLITLGLMLYLAFFLIRDGEHIQRRVAEASPLRPDHLTLLVGRFIVVVRATIKGSIVVAIIQGLIGGLVMWTLGIEAALLWGVLMGAASLIPAVGTGLVWVPMALYLLFTGSIWQGVALVFCGLFVIGMVDNILRPILVGRETRIPDYIVLLTTLGGLQLFGFHGIVIGPVIAAMFIAVWDIAVEMRKENLPARI